MGSDSSAAVAAPLQSIAEALSATHAAALVSFAKNMLECVWEGGDIDSFTAQDVAEGLGIIVAVEGGYDPDKHGPSDWAEPGQQWLEYSSWFKALAKGGK
jgi:hypothetical protein